MNRLVDAPLQDFEILCEAIRARPRRFVSAAYPPRCTVPAGPVTFTAVGDGGVEIAVQPAVFDGANTRVRELFDRGALRFDDATDLHAFATSDLLEAFDPVAASSSVHPAFDVRALVDALEAGVPGQAAAVSRLAASVAAGLARTSPRNPLVLVLAGPRDSGKARSVRTLAAALDREAACRHPLFEVGGRQLANDVQAAAVLGAPGWTSGEPPLARALRARYPIVLFRDVEQANADVVARVLEDVTGVGLRLPDGSLLSNPHAVIVLTTSFDSDGLRSDLECVVSGDRRRVESTWWAALAENVLPPDVLARAAIVAFDGRAHEDVAVLARRAVEDVGCEYGLEIVEVDRVICDTLIDIAHDEGDTALAAAARDLLAVTFAAVRETGGPLALKAGPPLGLERIAGRSKSDEDLAEDS